MTQLASLWRPGRRLLPGETRAGASRRLRYAKAQEKTNEEFQEQAGKGSANQRQKNKGMQGSQPESIIDNRDINLNLNP